MNVILVGSSLPSSFGALCIYCINMFACNGSSEQDENLHQRRMEVSSNLSGRSLRNTMLRSRTFTEGKLR
jgi:hypothetical protein